MLETYTESYWMEVQYQQGFWSSLYHAFLEEFAQILFIKIPMVYLMFYFLEKFSHQSKNWLKLILSLVAALLLFSVLGYKFLVHFVVNFIYPHLEIVGIYGFSGMINSFMDKIFIACVAISLKEYFRSQKFKQREKDLLKEKTETELNFLKSQINPHFLFNTLNNIYSLARKKSDETPDVVLKLSKLLRFVLYETKDKFITISREIEFLNDYIDLQKIRFSERLKIEFKYEIDDLETQIMPLVLIPFVENAFKHGASQSVDESYILIDLKIKENELFLSVENSFEIQNSDEPQGIGLKNIKRQLELFYTNFNFETNSEGNKFTAILSIHLNQYI
ncbi:GHKL domain-containing protein [Moheibacter sediminis]|uniref:GHKL domain-containing protein n=2 Tax=Moheibacter sediminis TaxID=1434700 RepID=A0A1W2CUE5_9FLAO|nr:GHKL domain-containing protein [Moheibacter sediminis]